MRLKRLEMENFKSFGGRKLSLDLAEGFTAITGPNGSGKSNLVDAILFMLVPRSSRPMRARRLQDLIYNGGVKGNPARFCRVAMTFDNSSRRLPVDADEVTFEREVRTNPKDRSKYSIHYRHNGKASSAGEFETLLSRAGIFADGYNIVQQGDITGLSEMGGAERRRVLEEVAGIGSFDRSLSKANTKRAGVEMDMALLMERRSEMDRLLKQLEREKRDAERLQKILVQIEEVALHLRHRKVMDSEADIASRREIIDDYQNQIEQAQARMVELQASIDETRTSLETVEARIEAEGGEEARQLQQALDEARVAQAKAQEAARFARQRLAELEQEQQAVARESTNLRKELGQTRRKEASAREKVEQFTREQEETHNRFEHLKREAADSDEAVAKLQEAQTKIKKEVDQATTGAHRLAMEVEGLQNRFQRQEAEVKSSHQKHKLAQEEAEQARWQLRDLQAGVNSVKDNLRKLKERVVQRDAELQDNQVQLRECTQQMEGLTQQQVRLRAEKSAEDTLVRGYSRAVQGILEARDQGNLENICGTIAELGSVDEAHRTALTVAAGGKMQSIVVENEEAAVAAISYIKTNRLGRARFLPLNRLALRGSGPSAAALWATREEGAVGFAKDLVRFDERYLPAFLDVFGDTVIMRTLEDARRVPRGGRLVTLDGELLERGGAMVGGTLARGVLSFGRSEKGELDRITSELTAARKQQGKLQSRTNKLVEELDLLRAEYSRLQGEQGSIQTRLTSFDSQTHQAEGLLKEAQAAHEHNEAELAATHRELEGQEAALVEARTDLEALEADLETNQKELERLAGGALAKELAGLREKLHQLREQLGTHTTAFDTALTQARLLEERLEELESGRAKAVTEQDRQRELASRSEQEAAQLTEQVAEYRRQETEHFSKLKGLRQERDALHDQLVEQRSNRTNLQNTMATRERGVADLRLEIRRFMEQLEEARKAVPLDYAPPAQLPPTAELQARLERLEEQRRRLGDVNMLSLDKFEQEQARYEELRDKIRELRREQRRLSRVAEKLNERKTTKFMGVFDQINTNLNLTYRELTGGGKAHLELERSESPFEGGLLIKVQPPRKKVYNMEALSGGEKSLVSMALIFAIQNFGPSPFYLLDEIDMNLDGVNTEHIGHTIAGHAQTAQFMVVSLHRSTLKESNHLIGVHMDSGGLSHLLALQDVNAVDEEGNFSMEGAQAVAG